MNTTVPYKRPSHLNRHGIYESITFCNRTKAGYPYVKVRIALVWFNRLGWYYHVELEAHGEPGKGQYLVDHSNDHTILSKGPELPLCAEAAEKTATSMLNNRGMGPLEFNPFELKPRENEPFDAKAYTERVSKDMETK